MNNSPYTALTSRRGPYKASPGVEAHGVRVLGGGVGHRFALLLAVFGADADGQGPPGRSTNSPFTRASMMVIVDLPSVRRFWLTASSCACELLPMPNGLKAAAGSGRIHRGLEPAAAHFAAEDFRALLVSVGEGDLVTPRTLGDLPPQSRHETERVLLDVFRPRGPSSTVR